MARSMEKIPGDVFHNKSIITDHHHLEDDLKHHIGNADLDKMSDEELEFYYFTMHDFDGNKMLDGLEIMVALRESLDDYMGSSFTKEELIKHYIAMTDEVLEEDDVNQDGFFVIRGIHALPEKNSKSHHNTGQKR
ncbi:multiple coagulation factor deficiency protein 2 homolog [Rhinatrema bivittatum]|uniref:multiple coagulation factor deficiency protein 2 homolog n=1 Tax=Rhinatrema bivittatum TaxID=194408 RepID=UPI0011298AFF|nr:multiple coagulation factor deficiency protein 2 homolog [Rhinatrema bivittatum]